MPAYTLRVRRHDPATATDSWAETTVELDAHRSVLDALLMMKEQDGTLALRWSCRAAICGSCGMRVNGRSGLACHLQLGTAARTAGDGPIVVEPLANMPVLKDLVVDMDAVHWQRIQRVEPWLQPAPPDPEREHVVPHAAMVDVTQTQACIQCGACVSDCLSLEVDPLFVGPAALAKAWRFVGDPRDAAGDARLRDLAEDRHGMYDCTHCFACIEACPKGVAPMSQIMRLRRAAGERRIVDPNNGYRHEHAFVENVKRNGLVNEADLVADSYGGRFHPRFAPTLLQSLPVIATALLRRKIGPEAIGHPHRSRFRDLPRIFDTVASRPEPVELNLYVSGFEDDDAPPPVTGPGHE